MIVACRTMQSFRNRNTCMYLVCLSYWFCCCCCSWKTFCDLQTVALSRFKAGEKQGSPLNDQSLVLGLIAHMRNFIARKESNQTQITAMLGCSHVSLWKFIMWTINPRSGKMIRFIGSTYGCKLDHFSRFLELLLFPWCHNSLCPPALHPTCMLVFSFSFYSSEAIPSHEINRLAADLLQWTASHKDSQAEFIPIPSLQICLNFMAVLASHVVKLLKCCSKQTWEHLKHDVQNSRTHGQLYLWLQFQE